MIDTSRPPKPHVLRVEGVNFDVTVYDTQDLSCIRGASLALLNMPHRVGTILAAELGEKQIRRIYAGASQCAFRIDAAPDRAQAALSKVREALASEGDNPWAARPEDCLPLAHLSFVADLAEAMTDSPDALDKALDHAEALNRARQFQSLTVRLPPFRPGVRDPDELGRILPGDATILVAADVDGSATPLPGETDEPEPSASKEIIVSRSVAARRHYGRHMRQAFYRQELGQEPGDEARGLRFTDSIGTLCNAPPDTVPEAVRHKIAVLYFDGNKFGHIRGELAKQHDARHKALTCFSEELADLRRNRLLRPLVARLKTGLESEDPFFAVPLRNGLALRFETLLWGGDEMMWVVPAWLAFWLVEGVFTLTRGWEIGGLALTHAGGVVLCDRKTPIRQAIAVARELADRAKLTKGAGGDPIDAVQIEVFESADLPDGRLDAHRRRLYPGLDQAFPEKEARGAAFTVPGDGIGALIDRNEAWKRDEHDGLPRSQVYRLLRQASEKRAFAGGAGEATIREALKTYLGNAGQGRAFDPEERGLSLELARIAQDWDYADRCGLAPLSLAGGGAR